MNATELGWLGLWTLVAYAPAAFDRLREHPLEQAIQPETLQKTTLGAAVLRRVAQATQGRGVRGLTEIATSLLMQLEPETFVVSRDGVPGALEALGAPPWFWARGDRALLQSIQGSVCVVGSRKTDAHGARMARHVVTAAVRDGWSVVSGGALGIDAVAHETCVAEGGKTIAVLPSGLDEPYPRRHRGLFDRIVQSGGLLLSPFPPGHKPRTWHFARRNVVMAAMSEVTVVVRAAPQSGSLITARAARSLGRRLLAVPGDAWRPELRGTAELLAEGAEVLVNPMEPGLGRRRPSPRCTALAQPTMSPFAARVAQALRAGPRHAEELAQALGEPLHGLHMPLLELELEGLIVRDGPEVYALTSAGVSV